jgi:hypothetical protein
VKAVDGAAGAADPLLGMPALVNAHDHGRAVRSSSIGGGGKPLQSWLHYLALFPRSIHISLPQCRSPTPRSVVSAR